MLPIDDDHAVLPRRLTNTIASPTVQDVIVRRTQLLDAAAAISPALGGRVLPRLLQPFQRDRYTAKDMEGALLQLSEEAEEHPAHDVITELNAARNTPEADRGNTEVAKAAQDLETSAKAGLLSASSSVQPVVGSRRKNSPENSTEEAVRKLVSPGVYLGSGNSHEQERPRDPAFSVVAAALQNDVYLALSHLRHWPEQVGDVLRASTMLEKRLVEGAAGIRSAQGVQAIHAVQCVAAALDPAGALPVLNLHICGDSYAGKTMTKQSLVMCATAPARLYNSSPLPDISLEGGRTVGVEEHSVEWVLRGQNRVCLRIYDYGGREEFGFNHAAHLATSNSVYLFVLPLRDKRPGGTYDQPLPIAYAVERYRAWLKVVNTVVPRTAHKPQVVTVINFASQLQREAGSQQQAVVDQILAVQNSFHSDCRVAFAGAPIWVDSNIPGRMQLEVVPALSRAFQALPRQPSRETPALQTVLTDMQVKNKWPFFSSEVNLRELLQAALRQKHAPPATLMTAAVMEETVRTIADISQKLLKDGYYLAELNAGNNGQKLERIFLHHPHRKAEQLIQSLFDPRRRTPDVRGTSHVVSVEAVAQAAKEMFGVNAPTVLWELLLEKCCVCIPVSVRSGGLYTLPSAGETPQYVAFPFFAPDYASPSAPPIPAERIQRQYAVRHPDVNVLPSGYISQLFVDIAGLYPDTDNRIELFKNALVLEVQAGPRIVIVANGEHTSFTLTVQRGSNVESELQRVRKQITEPASWRRNVELLVIEFLQHE
jgi:hypothetical protein